MIMIWTTTSAIFDVWNELARTARGGGCNEWI